MCMHPTLPWLPPLEQIFHASGDAARATGGAEGEGESGPISRGQMDNENIKHMLELLCNEAGFLVEGKIQKLLEPLPPDEQSLLKIDSILKARACDAMPCHAMPCHASTFMRTRRECDAMPCAIMSPRPRGKTSMT